MYKVWRPRVGQCFPGGVRDAVRPSGCVFGGGDDAAEEVEGDGVVEAGGGRRGGGGSGGGRGGGVDVVNVLVHPFGGGFAGGLVGKDGLPPFLEELCRVVTARGWGAVRVGNGADGDGGGEGGPVFDTLHEVGLLGVVTESGGGGWGRGGGGCRSTPSSTPTPSTPTMTIYNLPLPFPIHHHRIQ